MRVWLVMVLCLVLAACSGPETGEASAGTGPSDAFETHPERLALVIGNERYAQFSDRPGARADADLVAQALTAQGFVLVGGRAHHDLDWGGVVRHMRVLQARMDAGNVAVLYFAGHALNIDGENFIVPTDARAWDAATIDTQLVRLSGSLRPPAVREPRIKLIVLDRYLPGPLSGSPTPVVATTLAASPLDPNEAHIYSVGAGSLHDAHLGAEPPRRDGWMGMFAGEDRSMAGRSITARAFADALRTSYVHVLGVMYQVGVIVADQTSDQQHVLARYGEGIPGAGPLLGTGGAGSIVSRLEEAERLAFGENGQRRQGRAPAPFVAQIVRADTRSAQSLSDTVAVMTVLNIEDVFADMRAGRAAALAPEQEMARLEAWRSVLEQSRAATLDDYQKAAILSVTSSTSGGRLHRSGIADMLEQGRFETMADAIEALGEAEAREGTGAFGLQRRRLVERALFETELAGKGAGGIIEAFRPEGEPAPPERVRNATVNRARDAVAACSPVPLNANQLEALASFAASISIESFLSSSVCRRLGDRDLYAVAREIAYSSFELVDGQIVHDDALVRRRARETALFLTVTRGAARDRLSELRLARLLDAEAERIARTGVDPVSSAAVTTAVAANFRRADPKRIGSFIIRMYEGLHLDAYQDAVGIWTIGFGTTGPHVVPGRRISVEEAHQYLMGYVDEDWQAVAAFIEPDLTPQEAAAVLSLSYNIGRGALRSSTLVRTLNEGDRNAAADQFLVWSRARVRGELVVLRGLAQRREAERALFLMSGDAPPTAADILARHLPLRARAEEISGGRRVVGYGHIHDGSGPSRVTEAEARALLEADVAALRERLSGRLTRRVEAAQLDALVVIAYVMGVERIERSAMITYINEGNQQGSLAAVGYWDARFRGADGQDVPNWGSIRADAAALFVIGS